MLQAKLTGEKLKDAITSDYLNKARHSVQK